MKILIIGTGYVGLVTGVSFSEMGHDVSCLDIDENKISKLKKGSSPIYEPGLEEMIQRNLKANRLHFTTSYEETVPYCDICFLALPTPSNEDGSCDVQYVLKASKHLSKYLQGHTTIVSKSTVPVGTCFAIKKLIEEEIQKHQSEATIDIVSNPEFLKEGSAVTDSMRPDRIVIGTENQRSEKVMREAYAPFMLNHEKIIAMDILSSEMTKYAANAMLATRISFMNEMAEICTRVGANINNIRKGIGSDSRIGTSFLYAGVGYGGSCFPKDIRALKATAKQYGVQPLLLEAVESINERQKQLLSQSVSKYFTDLGGIKGKTIAVWGLAFKPDTDDMREAPSLNFIKQLHDQGAHIRVFDPVSMENAKNLLKDLVNITYCKDESEAAKGANGIALLTEWKQFRTIDFAPIKQEMIHKAFFDGRNQYNPDEMKNNGFDYFGIGLGKNKRDQ